MSPRTRAILVYSGLRLGLFAVIFGALLVLGLGGVPGALAALLLSGLASYFLLDRQRDAISTTFERPPDA